MDDKKIQAKLIGAVLVKMIPPAARVCYEWAEKLYDDGIRIHPELAKSAQAPAGTDTLPARTQPLSTQDAVIHQAMVVLRQMARHFPEFAPLVEQVETAKTPQEREAALTELRSKIDPQMLAAAQARAGLPDDDTE
jgi:RecA-family ATPase